MELADFLIDFHTCEKLAIVENADCEWSHLVNAGTMFLVT